jgi:hypothetical protein
MRRGFIRGHFTLTCGALVACQQCCFGVWGETDRASLPCLLLRGVFPLQHCTFVRPPRGATACVRRMMHHHSIVAPLCIFLHLLLSLCAAIWCLSHALRPEVSTLPGWVTFFSSFPQEPSGRALCMPLNALRSLSLAFHHAPAMGHGGGGSFCCLGINSLGHSS